MPRRSGPTLSRSASSSSARFTRGATSSQVADSSRARAARLALSAASTTAAVDDAHRRVPRHPVAEPLAAISVHDQPSAQSRNTRASRSASNGPLCLAGAPPPLSPSQRITAPTSSCGHLGEQRPVHAHALGTEFSISGVEFDQRGVTPEASRDKDCGSRAAERIEVSNLPPDRRHSGA